MVDGVLEGGFDDGGFFEDGGADLGLGEVDGLGHGHGGVGVGEPIFEKWF